MKTHWRKLKDTNYLGSWDVVDKELILTIKNIETKKVSTPDGKTEELPVMTFTEDYKPMILNATNFKNIAKAHGSNFIEDWIGKKISIYITSVKAFGSVVDALRIKPSAPKVEKPELTPDNSKFESIKAKLKSGETTIDTVKQYFNISDNTLNLLKL
jgi:hypothetical protein